MNFTDHNDLLEAFHNEEGLILFLWNNEYSN